MNIFKNFATNIPDSKVHSAKMGPNWVRQDPGGPHVGPMSLAIWGVTDQDWNNITRHSSGA